MPSGRGPRWCWSATTASSPPSQPAAASAPSASGWAPRELTVNRRQVEAWEQRAIDDVRAGNLEQAIAAYAEHDRIRAFEARDDRDRALVADWWQAHQAGERPVIYAHRRAQVDQLNSVCQRLRAEAGQLGPERLAVGDRSFAVGDVVVLGANARDRLGVVNGTTAVIQDLDLRGRAMTVRTLEEEPPRTVRLPGWYLDAAGPPGPVAPGRPGLCPHRHALPGPHRAAGAAGPGRRRGHAGRLCAAHPQHPADRPVPDRRPRTPRPRRRTPPSGQGAAGAGGAAGPGADP